MNIINENNGLSILDFTTYPGLRLLNTPHLLENFVSALCDKYFLVLEFFSNDKILLKGCRIKLACFYESLETT